MGDLSRQVYGIEPSKQELYMGLDLDAIRDRWNRKASRWDADLADPLFHLNEDDAYGRFLQTADAIIAQRRDFCLCHGLVDLGCGTGRYYPIWRIGSPGRSGSISAIKCWKSRRSVDCHVPDTCVTIASTLPARLIQPARSSHEGFCYRIMEKSLPSACWNRCGRC